MLGNYQVDENGNTYGFEEIDGEAGKYGENLFVGQMVDLPNGSVGKVEEVLTRIHTGMRGEPNYIIVRIKDQSQFTRDIWGYKDILEDSQ